MNMENLILLETKKNAGATKAERSEYFFRTEYEYELHRTVLFDMNKNTFGLIFFIFDMFVISLWTKYKYLNIFVLNIWILSLKIFKYSMEQSYW